jgi:DNA repair protein RecN (Recombination protein N)
MLRELRIKNFAVIDALALELGPGLNILTGETGAGKTIILDALGVISGERVTSDVIRHGEDEASVEAMFDGAPAFVSSRLKEAGCEFDDDLIIKRVLSRSGKNRVYVGGSLAPLHLLAEVGSALVHIYGQHEHHTLLRPETHLALLDGFGALAAPAEDMKTKFYAMASAWESLKRTRELLERRKREKGLLQAQAEELAKARLRAEEEAELEAKKHILVHAEKLYQGCREGEELLYEGEDALIGRLGRYGTKLRELASIDGGLKSGVELLESALVQLEEANTELRRYAERVRFEPGALEQLEDRLGEIHRLKRKYNGSVEDILRIEAEVAEKLQAFDRGEESLPALERAFATAQHAAWGAAAKLSLERQKSARRFKKELERELKSLGMPETTFEVHFLDCGNQEDEPPFLAGGKRISQHGVDQTEFYFSPNPGEPPKPIAKIASGGELSRLMLAIKSLVLVAGDIPTLLFDEVDAGIGGGVAEIVGKKLKAVAAAHQVICVTHLPQIAALADTHHAVRKEVVRGRTLTKLKRLDGDERVEEVARMLGGIKITDRTLRHAEEMVKKRIKAEA